QGVGRGDDHRIDIRAAYQRLPFALASRPVAGGEPLRPLLVRVADGDEARGGLLAQCQVPQLTDPAAADEAKAQPLCFAAARPASQPTHRLAPFWALGPRHPPAQRTPRTRGTTSRAPAAARGACLPRPLPSGDVADTLPEAPRSGEPHQERQR